ncbi:hypothetical protein [Methanoculleus chikugoensis]|uniref:hypothetical protein n=1 Tax=Methanoculleus chikugoensis TaxID=118126 RepID=UPI001FB2D9D0|nr:hypothetical protein [Methanoculleus chikugoensis]
MNGGVARVDEDPVRERLVDPDAECVRPRRLHPGVVCTGTVVDGVVGRENRVTGVERAPPVCLHRDAVRPLLDAYGSRHLKDVTPPLPPGRCPARSRR